MKLNLPKWPRADERVRLHFRRIPEQSCVLVAYAPSPVGGRPVPLAKARLYGRGVGSSATEHMVVPLKFEASTSELAELADQDAPPQIELQAEGSDGHDVDPTDLELIDVTVGR